MSRTMQEAFGLVGKRALITGGATGLGFAMAECMAEAGAQVVLVGRTESTLREAASRIGNRASFRVFDVSDSGSLSGFAANLLADGPIDILVNNAGNHCKKPIEELTAEDCRAVLEVHVMGALMLTRELLAPMRARRSGSVIFISSMSAHIGLTKVSAYAAAKSGVLGVMRTLASEAGGDGVRINAISPGFIDTPMFRQATDNDPERRRKILSRTPAGCFGKPEDIGWAAVYLASDAARYVNGVSLAVDGGTLIGF